VKKLFIDSDILLDLSLQRMPFYFPALNLMELCYQGRLQAITSPVAFVNTNYFLNKFTPSARMQSLRRIRSVVRMADVDESMIDLALASQFDDFEGAVQYYAAVNAGAEAIITRNIKDYKQSSIPILSPEDFLKTL
jgi:hypothetical protein